MLGRFVPFRFCEGGGVPHVEFHGLDIYLKPLCKFVLRREDLYDLVPEYQDIEA